MSKKFTGESPGMEAWMALHRTRDLLFRCEDRVVFKSGLTAEQYSVLFAMKHLDAPVRPTDIGRLLERKVNSVSMIADRMVKVGLVDRIRDLPDRREVRLVITSKGEKAFQAATPGVRMVIEEIFSPLSGDDTRTLVRLLETLSDKARLHLTSGNRSA